MLDNEFDEFAGMLDAVATLLRRPGEPALNPTARAMYFRALSAHSLAEVRAGLDAHMRDPQRGRFFPLPADVIAQIAGQAGNDGRPGPEEAWALAMRSDDEAETVVWTEEMAEAWTIARTVLRAGDEVGARMAFKEAYARLVDAARGQRRPAAWSLSIGHDPVRRTEAVRAAVEAGRLPKSELAALPAPSVDLLRLAYEPAPQGASQAELQAREAMRQLSERLKERMDGPSEDAQAKARTEELKAQTAEQVAAYGGRNEA